MLNITNYQSLNFKGEKPDISEINLAPEGSEFAKRVWQILCEIPYGEVTTYGAIAKKIALQMNQSRRFIYKNQFILLLSLYEQ